MHDYVYVNVTVTKFQTAHTTMSVDTVPKSLKQLRACLVCSLIKTFDQFETDGCDNCESVLHLKRNRDNVYDCTSSNFEVTPGTSKLAVPVQLQSKLFSAGNDSSLQARGQLGVSVAED